MGTYKLGDILLGELNNEVSPKWLGLNSEKGDFCRFMTEHWFPAYILLQEPSE